LRSSTRVLKLTLIALRIGWTAQRVSHTSIKETIDRVQRRYARRSLASACNISEATQATRNALRILRRLGRLDTCIIEAIIVSMLLRKCGETCVHIGFRESSGQQPDGHAWATLNQFVIEARAPGDPATHNHHREITRFPIPAGNHDADTR